MSYIPDCREDEEYNYKKLGKLDKEFVRGYDWCNEIGTDNFFDNMEDAFDEDSYLMHTLREDLPERMKCEYEIELSFIGKTETRQVETYGDLLRFKLLEYIENQRNELIVGMIEGEEQ